MNTSAKYRISEDDYVDAMRLHSRLSIKARGIFLLMGLIALLVAAFGANSIQAGAIGALMGVAIVLPLIFYVIAPIAVRRQYKKYKAMQDEFEVALADDGLSMSSRNGRTLIRWDQTLKWRENEQFVLIYPMPRIYYAIPKHVASSGFKLDLLRERLTSIVGPAV